MAAVLILLEMMSNVFVVMNFQVKREEVERRVKEDEEVYSCKFSDDAKMICRQVLALHTYSCSFLSTSALIFPL